MYVWLVVLVLRDLADLNLMKFIFIDKVFESYLFISFHKLIVYHTLKHTSIIFMATSANTFRNDHLTIGLSHDSIHACNVDPRLLALKYC